MSINLNQVILEIDGSCIKIRDTAESADRDMVLKDVLLRAMSHVKYESLGREGMIQEQLSPDEVGKRYDLIKKIRASEGECEITHDDKTLLRTKLCESQHPWIAGQAMDLLG